MNEAILNWAVTMMWALLLLCLAQPASGFTTPYYHASNSAHNGGVDMMCKIPHKSQTASFSTIKLRSTAKNDENEEDEEETKENPYADPNYPELEFVNYDDPEYVVDQGVGDEFFDPTSTEAQIEEMREDRRRRNDEFQFQTYFKELLKEGREYTGEWSVYQTSTFMEDMGNVKDDNENGIPRVLKSSRPLYVTSKAHKSTIETTSIHPTDAERIHHVETVAEKPASLKDDDEDEDDDDDDEIVSQSEEKLNKSVLQSTYWPEQLSAFDFRGEKGIMCVGAAYTICTCVSLIEDSEDEQKDGIGGPFSEYRTEMGLLSNEMRFRIKLDYRMTDAAKEEFLKSDSSEDVIVPPLCLKSLVVCRETLEQWPPSASSIEDSAVSNAFYGKPGAPGGLYDPPPVGSDEQAGKYMLLDLDGSATILFPYEMDQDPSAFEGNGWVTSLDWTPGTMRYQVDRKVQGGPKLRELRTLELSEVQSADADQYRPRDGGSDMRQ